MGFVERALTPPGTGDMSAVVAQQTAQANIEKATKALQAVPQMPSAPKAPEPPSAAPQFAAGSAPGAKQRAQITATMLGAAAAGGETARPGLGTSRKQSSVLGA